MRVSQFSDAMGKGDITELIERSREYLYNIDNLQTKMRAGYNNMYKQSQK